MNKNISLPRLELSGALLLSKLIEKIKSCLNNYDIQVYGWSDSMAVLGWLHGDAERWKPFVANRVKQITESMPKDCWRYVKSKENPADCASRGLTASQLKEFTLWWNGPHWLPTYQPTKEIPENKFSTNQEMRKVILVNTAQHQKHNIINTLLKEHSSLSKVIRIISWIRRFIYRKTKSAFLLLQEIREARLMVIKQVQADEFSEEIGLLKHGKSVSKSSKLNNLDPMLDENGVLRLSGRLRHACMDFDTRHPIIIPNGTRLAELLIDEAHELTYHGGPRLTTAFMRQKYWLTGGIRVIKKHLRHCVICRKQNPDQQYQIMGDLPSCRTNQSRPFYHTGVDYTGHVMVKANKGRGIKTTKGYVAVFVCMATKAVHLELVSDLSTSAFLAALRRMAARRGAPGHIYSDQGTNFVGANKVLQQEYEHLQTIFSGDFMTEVTNMGIEWHFNAPAWPSAGGLWEAAVKSLKHHLRRVIGEQKLTFEEYSTLLAQLESCLNSRPLCPLTEDPQDLDVLTPGHFLTSGPALNIHETEADLRTRWTLTQKLLKDLWDRWRYEYLTLLAARSKWRKPQRNVQLNDIVTIRDENLPPGKWALGCIIALHPGSDGYVRVVTLKTKSGVIKRPVVKISVLPVATENQVPETNATSPLTEKETNSCNSTTISRKQYSFTSLVIAVLLFFMTIITTTQGAYNITPLQNNSIYFDNVTKMHLVRDEWRLVVYQNTKPYEQGNKALTKYIQYLDQLCVNIKERSHCDGIMLQLRHEFAELRYYNNILSINASPTGTRRRRGLIDGVGYVANGLFGVLDARFAEKYKQDINLLRENQKHLALLLRNQTSVVESELNLLKRTEDIIEKHHKLVNSKLNSLENGLNQFKRELQNVSITTEFISTAMMANNILSNLKNIQQTLLNTLTNVYNGKFNFHLLTPSQLKDELNTIARQLPKDLSLPVDNYDFYEIYNLLEVRARMSDMYLIFEIKIPLIGRDMFEILRLIPIPYLTDYKKQTTVVPISEYAAINLKKDAFIPLTENNLKSYIAKDPQLSLCRLKNPIYGFKDDQSFCKRLPDSRKCITFSSFCENDWIELNKLNAYFFSCCDRCQIKLLCEDHVTGVQMTRTGLFNVDQECVIKTADFVVYSHKQSMNKVNLSSQPLPALDISPINHIVNISIPDQSTLTNYSDSLMYNIQLQNIQQQLEIMRSNEPLAEKVSYHDIHHYTAIYVMFAVIAIGTAVWACRRGRRSAAAAIAAGAAASERSGPPPAPAPRSSICVQCSDRVMGNQCSVSEINERPYQSARPSKQNKSTSPVLRSVFHISNSGV